MRFNLIHLLSFLLISSTFASELSEESLREKFEREMLNFSPTQQGMIYSNIGKDLYQIGLTKEAQEAWWKAVSLIDQDKKDIPLLGLSLAAYTRGQRQVSLQALKNIQEREKLDKEILASGQKKLARYLTSMQVSELSRVDLRDLSDGMKLGLKKRTISWLVQNKKYKKALSLYDAQKVRRSKDIEVQSEFDLLTFLVRKNGEHNPHCRDIYEKYPKSYSYGIILCRLLLTYKERGFVSKKDKRNLNGLFKEFNREKSYLAEAVKDLPQRS